MKLPLSLATRDRVTLGAASALVFAALAASSGCSDTAGSKATTTTPTDDGGADGGDTFSSSEELKVDTSAGRVYVKLASPPAIVKPADPKTDKSWDLAFEGADVFTNSGPSGSGGRSAFGPLDPIAFIDDAAPATPFLTPDTTGGAFIRWWFYGGGQADHALFSRFHTYGIKDGAKLYKVQVLAYDGLRDGAPVHALYRIRYAEVTATGSGPTKDVMNLDGTALQTMADAKQECIDLGTGTRTMFTTAEARASNAWHLCFRRQDISVNGEVGGPRGVGAVDLDADKSATETLSDVFNKTPESELAKFDAVNQAALMNQPFRGDRVVSAFGTLWLERGANPLAPSKTAWLVDGGDGTSKYLVGFARFDGATATAPGTIVMRVKTVK